MSGFSGPVVLKSTGSEFQGFLKDEYTTLAETDDRILATSLVARWRYDAHGRRTGTSPTTRSRRCCSSASPRSTARRCSRRCTAWARPCCSSTREVAEIRFSAPNKHHFLVDLSPFGVENPGEVFYAADRPYGLIEATVLRDDASDPGSAWLAVPGFC